MSNFKYFWTKMSSSRMASINRTILGPYRGQPIDYGTHLVFGSPQYQTESWVPQKCSPEYWTSSCVLTFPGIGHPVFGSSLYLLLGQALFHFLSFFLSFSHFCFVLNNNKCYPKCCFVTNLATFYQTCWCQLHPFWRL